MIQFSRLDLLPYAAALAAIWLIWSIVGIARNRSRWTVIASRGAALLALTLAALHPYRSQNETIYSLLALIDVSESVEGSRGEELLERARSYAAQGFNLELLPFAGRSAPYPVSIDQADSYEALRRRWGGLNSGESNLAAAAEAASALGGGNMLLVSDGFETAGNVEELLEQGSAGLRLYPLLPDDPNSRSQEFRISQIFAPLTAPAQKSVDVRLTLENSSAAPRRGTLRITHGGKELLSRAIELKPGERTALKVESDPGQEGISEVVATLTPNDSSFPSSTAKLFIAGEKREKVLLINGAAEDERVLRRVLEDQSYQLTPLTAAERGTALPPLKDFSVVIFNNVALTQLAAGSDDIVARFVRDGGGFVMIGGNRSFGLGGYRDTAIAEILPVDPLPPETVKKRLNVAVQLVLDKSRSMATDNKLEFAKEAARETIRNLKNEDYVGVIGFDASPFVVVKLGLLSTTRDQALSRVGRLFAAGRTNLFPAMDEARRALERVAAGRKHMIVLTDGIIPDSGPYYLDLVRQMRLAGITISTVLLGGDADPEMLKVMAELGGGAFYQTRDARRLPRIFLEDIQVTTGERTLKEDQQYLVRVATDRPRITKLQSFPPLRGYVKTKKKPSAVLDLELLDSQEAQPLLASWPVGKGRSVAYTSDANGRWSNAWVGWGKFREFWAQVVDALRPEQQGAGRNIKFDLNYFVERGTLKLDLSVFSEGVRGPVTAVVKLPDQTERELSFSPSVPGRFAAELPKSLAGDYQIAIRAADDPLTPVGFHLPGELFGEKQGQGFNTPLLERIAFATGGRANPSAESLRSEGLPRTKRTELVWPLLLLAGLLLLLEIFAREIGFRLFRRTARQS